jgi:hypothetical protein
LISSVNRGEENLSLEAAMARSAFCKGCGDAEFDENLVMTMLHAELRCLAVVHDSFMAKTLKRRYACLGFLQA